MLDFGFGLPASLRKYIIGVVKGADLEELYAWSDLILIPSLWEGLPLAMLEAVSKGVVPIVSDVGGMGDFVREHGVGAVVDWHNVSEVLKLITSMIEDPKIINQYQKSCIEYSSRHSWNDSSKEFLDEVLN